MNAFKLGRSRVWMTKRGIEESRVHLQVRKGKAALTAEKFRDLHEWFEEEDTRLVRKSLVRAKKQAPVFALGEICAISGEQLDDKTPPHSARCGPVRKPAAATSAVLFCFVLAASLGLPPPI